MVSVSIGLLRLLVDRKQQMMRGICYVPAEVREAHGILRQGRHDPGHPSAYVRSYIVTYYILYLYYYSIFSCTII